LALGAPLVRTIKAEFLNQVIGRAAKNASLAESTSPPLSHNQKRLLAALESRMGRVLTHDELMSFVWPKKKMRDHALNVLVDRTRRALGPRAGRRIENVRGIGFRLRPG
jgi:DNA-binding winged helix-turn-helix (wHTH) protein